MTETAKFYRTLMLQAFETAVRAARPETCLPPHLPDPPRGKTYVIGAGKAAAKMAQVFEKHWPADYEGMVITRYGHEVSTKKIQVLQASHPVPDTAGMHATHKIIDFIKPAGADDLVIFLLSGGGSALMSCPEKGIDFKSLQNLNTSLLNSGAPIAAINTLRKHLNSAFGGKLAKIAAPARCVTLAISDVTGDDPSVIASGPTVGDPTSLQDCLDLIQQYDLPDTTGIIDFLQNPDHETPKPQDDVFNRCSYSLIATPQTALQAAANYLQENGIRPYILSDSIEGDTNAAARFHSDIVQYSAKYAGAFSRPCTVLSGGETTVKITGTGHGGPNTQFMLQTAISLNGAKDIYALACDTDGIDGNRDVAGAFIDPSTLSRGAEMGLDAAALLADNNSFAFFDALGDCIIPGPTQTNVNDFRLFLLP